LGISRTTRRDFVKLSTVALAGATSGALTGTSYASASTASSQAATLPESAALPNRVIVYPAPEGEILSPDYVVEVNGKSIPVYAIKSQWHDKKYSAAYFDFSGTVTVKIRPNPATLKTTPALDQLAIRPAKYGIQVTIANGEASFTTDKHFDISFEPTGQNSPLHLFSNPIEVDPPKPGDRNVIYFGPGIHKPERIDLTAGQTLYIAGGAIVKAAVTSSGDNIRIMGRGILCGNDWPHSKGPTARMVWPADGRNILLEDIIIRGAWNWTVAPSRCDQVLIRNLRICGSRCGNDDGIDPCNSSNVTIRNCFVHTDDDGIAVKGTANSGQNPKTTENIVVEDCTFWIDFANGFRIGAESRAFGCRNFTARNIDIIHFPNRSQVDIFLLHPTDNMPMENLVFEDIRINGETPLNLARLTPQAPIQRRPPAPGAPADAAPPRFIVPGDGPYIHNVTFNKIEVYGKNKSEGPLPRVYLEGLTREHNIANVTFDRVTRYGELLTASSSNIRIEKFVEQVRFNGTAATELSGDRN
jgi:hypothetical protein